MTDIPGATAGATSTSTSTPPVGDVTAQRYVSYLEALASKWSAANAASLLDGPLLQYLAPRYHRCSTPIKVRVILSFLYLSAELRLQQREVLLRILGEAEVDRDEWVRKLSRLVSSSINVGSVDVRETDSETAFQLLKYLNTQRETHNLVFLNKPPLDAPHLANALTEKSMRPQLEAQLPSHTILPAPALMTAAEVCDENYHFKPQISFADVTAGLMRSGDAAMQKALDAADQQLSVAAPQPNFSRVRGFAAAATSSRTTRRSSSSQSQQPRQYPPQLQHHHVRLG